MNDLLTKKVILNEINCINSNFLSLFSLKIFDSIESTNKSLKSDILTFDLLLKEKVLVYSAEHQTSGKGRGYNKNWSSPYAENLYTSFAWKLSSKNLKTISSLSIKVAQIIIKLLTELGCEKISFKWPNDVFVDKKKISGVLIDLVKLDDGDYAVIIGVGLNVYMQEDSYLNNTSIKYCAPSDLDFNRNNLLAKLIVSLVSLWYQKDYSIDFNALKEYNILNYNKAIDKSIKLRINNQEYTAKYLDISNDGALEVLIDDKIKKIYSVDKLIL